MSPEKLQPVGRLADLWIYPVKGLAGVRLDRAYVERPGLRHDRRWMIVDADGVFVSQRKVSAMATLRPCLSERTLVIESTADRIEVPLNLDNPQRLDVQIWKSRVSAALVGFEADRWLSSRLGFECRLVVMDHDSHRSPSADFSQPGDQVSFADGYPILLATDASLSGLNSCLEAPVPMDRFRPNLVVDGVDLPWAEEGWKQISVSNLTLRNAKPCRRCIVTTIDQTTGEPTGPEPLRTLAQRPGESTAHFGVNLIPDDEGWVSVGDQIFV